MQRYVRREIYLDLEERKDGKWMVWLIPIFDPGGAGGTTKIITLVEIS